MIAPHRRKRRRPKTQDGRKLRRYKKRWKIERLFAWLGNFRRLVVRYERRVGTTLDSCGWGASSSCLGIYEMGSRNSVNAKFAEFPFHALR
jgi:transposase